MGARYGGGVTTTSNRLARLQVCFAGLSRGWVSVSRVCLAGGSLFRGSVSRVGLCFAGLFACRPCADNSRGDNSVRHPGDPRTPFLDTSRHLASGGGNDDALLTVDVLAADTPSRAPA
eukprot:1192225-Prorocentrum_minimum.AAC.3